jgi:hypothetical protein
MYGRAHSIADMRPAFIARFRADLADADNVFGQMGAHMNILMILGTSTIKICRSS